VGQSGLADAKDVFEDEVSPGQEGRNRKLHDPLLTVEYLLQLRYETVQEFKRSKRLANW
jgi:hypothetical protein